MTERKRSKAEERAFAELRPMLQHLQLIAGIASSEYARLRKEAIPPGWAAVEGDHPVRPKKVRIHASYDADVAGFFRSMGQGYQARMNAVLRAYMLAVQSREIPSKKNEDWMGNQI